MKSKRSAWVFCSYTVFNCQRHFLRSAYNRVNVAQWRTLLALGQTRLAQVRSISISSNVFFLHNSIQAFCITFNLNLLFFNTKIASWTSVIPFIGLFIMFSGKHRAESKLWSACSINFIEFNIIFVRTTITIVWFLQRFAVYTMYEFKVRKS